MNPITSEAIRQEIRQIAREEIISALKAVQLIQPADIAHARAVIEREAKRNAQFR